MRNLNGTCLIVFLVFNGMAGAQVPSSNINPSIERIVQSVSEQRIHSILEKLESFGTRHVMSAQDQPAQGIGAAARWIYAEFKSYTPRLEISYQPFHVKKAGAYGQRCRARQCNSGIARDDGSRRLDPGEWAL